MILMISHVCSMYLSIHTKRGFLLEYNQYNNTVRTTVHLSRAKMKCLSIISITSIIFFSLLDSIILLCDDSF